MGERYVIKDRWIFDTKLNKNIHSIDCYEEKNVLDIMNGQNERIAELQKQLEEKEKDNQFFKKMYLSEKQKNDNYHTEKYGLDKPVEELRKIKLTLKEKEIYYKGFDNCERQFATHIAELEQQLEEKEKKIEKLREWLSQCEADRKSEQEKKNLAFKKLAERSKQLHSQPAEIVEKINGEIYTRMVVECKKTKYTDINLILNTILKEYQK